MAMAYELYIKKDTWVHRLDPRVKLGFFVSTCVLVLVINNLSFQLGYMGICLLILGFARTPKEKSWYVCKLLTPLIVCILALSPPWLAFGEPLVEFWTIKITLGGILMAFVLTIRMINMALAAFIMMFTTEQKDLALALVKLKLPYKYGLAFAIAMRYAGTFGGIWKMITDAQKARGYETLERGNVFERLRSYIPTLAPLAIQALRMADMLAVTLQSRAFGTPIKRTFLRDLKMNFTDKLVIMILIISCALVYIARFLLGFGASIGAFGL